MLYGRNIVNIGPTWLCRREIGILNPIGSLNRQFQQLYSSTKVPIAIYDRPYNLHGGIFSLEFSPSGSYLVAACEKRCLLIFDPLNPTKINMGINDAHSDCVNCVKFIDNNLFATCSDDSTVALWDVRNLNNKLRSLEGHLNWVKSIEFSVRDKLLVSSGFDGRVLTWDIHGTDHSPTSFERVFVMNGLMRSRLSPDGSKLILCTTAGYIIVIHNLNLSTLAQDIGPFKPNLYRLMQMSQTELPAASEFTGLFRKPGKRNRVEFIVDFPGEDDAEVVSSLQVHPHGHSIGSRNVTNDENSEWSCVHNIEERLSSDDEDSDHMNGESTAASEGAGADSDTDISDIMLHRNTRSTQATTIITRGLIDRITQNDGATDRQRGNRNAARMDDEDETNDLRMSPADVWEAVVAIQEARQQREASLVNEFNLQYPVSYERSLLAMNSTRISARRRRPIVVSLESGRNLRRNNPEPGQGPFPNPRSLAQGRLNAMYELNETARLEDFDIGTGAGMRLAEGHNALMRRCLNVTLSHERERGAISSSSDEEEENEEQESERVIPMSVYRTAGDAGLPGNSMQRHNIGTMSVSTRNTTINDVSRRAVKRRRSHRRKINKNIYQNVKRLTHYVEEPNVGRGFIKEICFSSDGRVLCSPFGHGFRLLSFSPDATDVSYCYPVNSPKVLHELISTNDHQDVVVSTKFCPNNHYLLTSGCLSGRICFYQPCFTN